MKYLLLVLSIIIWANGFSQSTYANQIESPPTGKLNQAGSLVTKPATINDWYVYTGNPKNRSIYVRKQECQKKGIFQFIKNPDAFFQACPDSGKKIAPSYEPVGETKIPHLDSGVNFTVTKF